MNPLKRLWLTLRISRRVGAFARAMKDGMSGEQARAYSDSLYPPTRAELAYEASLRFARLRKEVEASANPESALADLDAFTDARTSNDALEEFVTMLASHAEIKSVLHRYGWIGVSGFGGKEKLVDLYKTLALNCAGQWVDRTYVLTASLCDPELLALLLREEARGVDGIRLATTAVRYVDGRLI